MAMKIMQEHTSFSAFICPLKVVEASSVLAVSRRKSLMACFSSGVALSVALNNENKNVSSHLMSLSATIMSEMSSYSLLLRFVRLVSRMSLKKNYTTLASIWRSALERRVAQRSQQAEALGREELGALLERPAGQ